MFRLCLILFGGLWVGCLFDLVALTGCLRLLLVFGWSFRCLISVFGAVYGCLFSVLFTFVWFLFWFVVLF